MKQCPNTVSVSIVQQAFFVQFFLPALMIASSWLQSLIQDIFCWSSMLVAKIGLQMRSSVFLNVWTELILVRTFRDALASLETNTILISSIHVSKIWNQFLMFLFIYIMLLIVLSPFNQFYSQIRKKKRVHHSLIQHFKGKIVSPQVIISYIICFCHATSYSHNYIYS